MDYGVKDGVAINALKYEKNRRTQAHKFIGRKNMLNNFSEDHDFKIVSLIIDKDSTTTTYDSVTFDIDDFEDGHTNDVNTYRLVLEAIPTTT